jgi:hypothetical protein
MSGCREDGVIVFGKDFEPVTEVVGMVCPDLRGDAEVGTEESGAKLCDQLFAGIARVAETLPAEIAVETCLVTSPRKPFPNSQTVSQMRSAVAPQRSMRPTSATGIATASATLRLSPPATNALTAATIRYNVSDNIEGGSPCSI